MLQYLINTSIIWLACLLLYELLLRRESFYQYNRAYLLASLALGLLLPAAKVDNLLPADHSAFRRPTEQVYQIRKAVGAEQVIKATSPLPQAQNNTGPILWAIYLTGVLAGMVIMGREVLRLRRLYVDGHRNSEDGYVIVETGKKHCPFSFFNIVFITSRRNYTHEQWTLLTEHEKEHSRQFHSLDNLLMLMLRIVCWFHPLPHIYYKRLRMVHEFQADHAASANIEEYGTFLLEQSLLQAAPALSHSINYSPVKTRIAMLVKKKSTRSKLVKYLALIPLLCILTLFCTQTSYSGEINRKSNKAHFKGNEIEFGSIKVIPFAYRETMKLQKDMLLYATLPDSVSVKDRVTGYMKWERVLSDTMPVAINHKPVFGNESKYLLPETVANYIPPVVNGNISNLEEYLFLQLKEDLDKLEDGGYALRVNRLVIDDKGNIAYYEPEGLDFSMSPNETMPIIADNTRHIINQKLANILEGGIKFKPALKDGRPVNARLALDNYEVIVKGHKAKLIARGGC